MSYFGRRREAWRHALFFEHQGIDLLHGGLLDLVVVDEFWSSSQRFS
jgi:hypothetical protein